MHHRQCGIIRKIDLNARVSARQAHIPEEWLMIGHSCGAGGKQIEVEHASVGHGTFCDCEDRRFGHYTQGRE